MSTHLPALYTQGSHNVEIPVMRLQTLLTSMYFLLLFYFMVLQGLKIKNLVTAYCAFKSLKSKTFVASNYKLSQTVIINLNLVYLILH